MLKEALITLGLTDEQADTVLGYHTESLAGYVPKEKLDESEAERLRLSDTLKERDKQLEGLKSAAGSSVELKQQLEKAIADNEATAKKAAADLAAFKLESTIHLLLTKEGAKNTKAVIALLDLGRVKMDGESVTGLADQVVALKTSDPYLFVPRLGGRELYGGSRTPGDEMKDNPFKKETWNLTKQGRLFKENPELYAKLKAAAGNQ